MPNSITNRGLTLTLTLVKLPALKDVGEEIEQLAHRCSHWLSDDELARIGRATLPGLSMRQRLVRLCLRAELARQTQMAPEAFRFDYGTQGKPELRRQQGGPFAFNLSHSGDLLLVGVIRAEDDGTGKHNRGLYLGVDIERKRTNTDINAIYRHYFSAPEQAYLASLDNSLKRDAFFDLWALKESYIKATGRGLAEGLQSFAFDLNLASLRQKEGFTQFYQGLEPKMLAREPNCTQWQSWLGHIDSDYRLAVTLGAEDKVSVEVMLNQRPLQSLLGEYQS
ncbi:4'-phosphopantetheinyl transferase family protein [Shewanella litorisediminis]|uniref:4'-phosphopantetheinyl transferase superfamily protein n=1 Tax=Shewanella litorisediminis TaxID=1173586 RepID=A0ABX7G671_9GAMM|nr:4'-phosphopantetheinyl transferase superfamily protein [Shewanella litorisediminis]MCL2916981.1 4'-phosphopantetheinyl transferase superfamily protein [Shewanella litorisediminis]QRH02861.1 4'-phosphopantetheinyl transferase superfamily protein [Shewanella litorisediminis]